MMKVRFRGTRYPMAKKEVCVLMREQRGRRDSLEILDYPIILLFVCDRVIHTQITTLHKVHR